MNVVNDFIFGEYAKRFAMFDWRKLGLMSDCRIYNHSSFEKCEIAPLITDHTILSRCLIRELLNVVDYNLLVRVFGG